MRNMMIEKVIFELSLYLFIQSGVRGQDTMIGHCVILDGVGLVEELIIDPIKSLFYKVELSSGP